MSALPAELVLGPATGTFVWIRDLEVPVEVPGGADPLPYGLLIDHGDHTLLVPWATYPGGPARVFSLESLVPLTVAELVRCSICGVEGRIEGGAWVPTEGGQGG